MPGLLQLRANLAADISHVVSFREVKLDFELYYIIYWLVMCLAILQLLPLSIVSAIISASTDCNSIIGGRPTVA